jgi:hypothetical protein
MLAGSSTKQIPYGTIDLLVQFDKLGFNRRHVQILFPPSILELAIHRITQLDGIARAHEYIAHEVAEQPLDAIGIYAPASKCTTACQCESR